MGGLMYTARATASRCRWAARRSTSAFDQAKELNAEIAERKQRYAEQKTVEEPESHGLPF